MARRKKLKRASFPVPRPIDGVALGAIECGVAYRGRATAWTSDRSVGYG